MDCTQFLHKNCISFDVNQFVVCEHIQIVCENTLFPLLDPVEHACGSLVVSLDAACQHNGILLTAKH